MVIECPVWKWYPQLEIRVAILKTNTNTMGWESWASCLSEVWSTGNTVPIAAVDVYLTRCF